MIDFKKQFELDELERSAPLPPYEGGIKGGRSAGDLPLPLLRKEGEDSDPAILFTGGGTMGPVTPLVAVMRQMKKRRTDLSFFWAGTPKGPEREVVERDGVKFYPIPVAKFPRYPSLSWLTWPINMLRARFASIRVTRETKAALVASAGGFTSVPVIRAARRKRIPCAIHQLDLEPGLSNVMVAHNCQSVTTSFKYDFPPFHNTIAAQVPTPCRFAGAILPDREKTLLGLGLDPKKMLLVVVGGGTGATTLNDVVQKMLEKLLPLTQVIHLTGKGKALHVGHEQGYVQAEFFDEGRMLAALAAADLVVSRAGIGAISELACLSKAAILVPIPKSHQEKNAARLPFAAVQQGKDFESRLFIQIKQLLADPEKRQQIGASAHTAFPTDDGSALAEKWLKLVV